jgi:hypothetical protein
LDSEGAVVGAGAVEFGEAFVEALRSVFFLLADMGIPLRTDLHQEPPEEFIFAELLPHPTGTVDRTALRCSEVGCGLWSKSKALLMPSPLYDVPPIMYMARRAYIGREAYRMREHNYPRLQKLEKYLEITHLPDDEWEAEMRKLISDAAAARARDSQTPES